MIDPIDVLSWEQVVYDIDLQPIIEVCLDARERELLYNYLERTRQRVPKPVRAVCARIRWLYEHTDAAERALLTRHLESPTPETERAVATLLTRLNALYKSQSAGLAPDAAEE